MSNKTDYRPRRHINAVLDASKARYSVRSVLQAICHFAEFDRPESTFTKVNIIEMTRLKRKAVQRALAELRNEGVLKPVQGFAGGRGNAVTYRLCIVGQGAKEAEKQTQPAGEGTPWDAIADKYKAIDANEYKSHLAKVQFGTIEAGEMRLIAPSKFAAQYAQTHLAQNILSIAQGIDPTTTRIKFIAA